MIISELLKSGEHFLDKHNIENAKNEPKFILSKLLSIPVQELYLHDLDIDTSILASFYHILEKRAEHIPLQYLLGVAPFYGLELNVKEGVFIPRFETEVLVEKVISFYRTNEEVAILDMCTGPGTIAVSLAYELPNARITAVDISSEALELLVENAQKYNVENQINSIESDMFACLDEDKYSYEFDSIICNPPYIAKTQMKDLPKDVQNDPHIALTDGDDGLTYYRILAKHCEYFLKPAGSIFLEIGDAQAEEVSTIFKRYEYVKRIEVYKDLTGRDRVVVINLTM